MSSGTHVTKVEQSSEIFLDNSMYLSQNAFGFKK